jgi:putative transposase
MTPLSRRWSKRKVLASRISNFCEADFCVEALNEAIHRFGAPEIMITDQGSHSPPSPGPTA